MDIIKSLADIGAIQFGQFETPDQSGTFAPIAINLRLLPSYPSLLRALATDLVPVVKIEGLTRLLVMPSAVPIGTAVSLATELPLLYPSGGNPGVIEGAYDFNVPTVLLTDVLTDGIAESTMIQRVKGLGLDVEVVVAVLDMGFELEASTFKFTAWRDVRAVLGELTTLTPSMQAAVLDWLHLKSGPKGRLWAR